MPQRISTEEVLRDDVSFLKVGSEIYSLTKVDCDIKQTIQHMQDHFKGRVDATLNDLQSEAFGRADAAAAAELEHVTRISQRNNVQVPADKHEQMLVVLNREVCVVKPIQFYVTAMRGRAYHFRSGEEQALSSKFPVFAREYNAKVDNHDLIVTFQTSPIACISYAYSPSFVAVNRRVFHAYDTQIGTRMPKWYKLCTGSHTSQQFWSQSGLEDALRVVNLDSPATRMMEFDVPRMRYSTADLIRTFECTYAFVPINTATGAAEGWSTGGAQ